MDDAFGVLGGPARVDDIGEIVRLGRHAGEGRGRRDQRLDRGPAVARAANDEIVLQVGRVGRDRVDFTRVGRVRDDDGRAGMIGAKEQILGPQLLGPGDSHGTEAEEPQHREQPGRNFRQNDDHAVALAHADVTQRGGPPLRLLGDL